MFWKLKQSGLIYQQVKINLCENEVTKHYQVFVNDKHLT